jgi:hypothetical protein
MNRWAKKGVLDQVFALLISLAQPDCFRRFLHNLFRQDWVVYAKPPFGGAEHVLHYLARYTHRVAISNHRLVAFHDDRVSFRWKDYAHGGKQKLMILPAEEFLRRFLLHVLPKGLVRIRHFGLFANRRRTAMLNPLPLAAWSTFSSSSSSFHPATLPPLLRRYGSNRTADSLSA